VPQRGLDVAVAEHVGGHSGVGGVVGNQIAQGLAEAVAGRFLQALAKFSANLSPLAGETRRVA
jgi:hypothetical protein